MIRILYGQNAIRYGEAPIAAGQTVVSGTPVTLGASGWVVTADAARPMGFILNTEENSPVGYATVVWGPGTVFETDQFTATGLAPGDELEVDGGKLVEQSAGVVAGLVLSVSAGILRFVSLV